MTSISEEFVELPSKMSGYLMKKSTAGDWQRRYFETNGSFLTYYKSQKMSKLLAALSLPQVGDISMCTSDIANGELNTFQLDLKDRQYILKGSDDNEAKQWVDTLIFLRDGGGVTAAKQAKSANNTPNKSKEVDPIRTTGDGEVEEVETNQHTPKAMAADPGNQGTFVKNDAGINMDQCVAGCVIS